VEPQPTPYASVRRLQTRRDIDGLRHSDPFVRKEAASALRQLDAVRAVPARHRMTMPPSALIERAARPPYSTLLHAPTQV